MRLGGKGGPGAIAILEEAVNLLRSAPLASVAAYLAGAVPFVLGFLYFLSDMTRSPFAFEQLAAASLGLAGLYVWKSVWQAVFAAGLYRQLAPGAGAAVRVHGMVRLIAIQSALQPLSLVAVPLGLLITVPFAWIVAFFRNAALFAALGDPDPLAAARRQAGLWTRQNWSVLGLITLAWLLLFVNLVVTIAVLPLLARSFLGMEGDFVRLGARILNVSTLSVGAALACLAIDPLLDAVYVLRCFYGQSLATGEDLRAGLRRAVAQAAALTALALAAIVFTPQPMQAQTGTQRIESIDPAKLDRSMSEVIRRREFTWREPRPPGEEPQGRLVNWYRSLLDMMADAWSWVRTKIGEFLKWLNPQPSPDRAQDAPGAHRTLEWLIGLAVVLIVAAGVFFLRRRGTPVVSAEAVTAAAAAVNLADESLTADQLPESSWRKLAEEWLAKGDCRLALRALYLAGLNYLGGRELVSLRSWKSGLDYRRELERRARAKPEVGPLFARNVEIFERGWYGSHAVDRAMVEAFAAGLTEIRDHAERT